MCGNIVNLNQSQHRVDLTGINPAPYLRIGAKFCHSQHSAGGPAP